MESRFLVAVLITAFLAATLVMVEPTPEKETTVAFIDGNKSLSQLNVRIADTAPERERGLMFEKELSEDRGMLFIFPNNRIRNFWMKNTYIPLDIIFIADNRTIVNIVEAQPQPNTPTSELELYSSERPSKYVIEANKGYTEEKGIEEGDRIEILR